MKSIPFYLLLAAVLSLSSCVTSLNPLITYSNIERFDAAVGVWTDSDGARLKIEPFANSSFAKQLTLAKAGNTKQQKQPVASADEAKYNKAVYVLTYTDNEIEHTMMLSFARFNGSWVAQFAPALARSTARSNDAGSNGVIWSPEKDHSYSFAKIEASSNGLVFIPLAGSFIEDRLRNGRLAIPYEKNDLFGLSLITAAPGQLQKFFQKYSADTRIFDSKNALTLKPASK